MYKIGEVSEKVGLSIKTLRYYDKFGILKPSYVDKFTGYRYYTDDDVLKCEYIKLLKSLDYTLKEISENNDGLDEESINKKQKELEIKIKDLKRKQKVLNQIKKKIGGTSIFSTINLESDKNE